MIKPAVVIRVNAFACARGGSKRASVLIPAAVAIAIASVPYVARAQDQAAGQEPLAEVMVTGSRVAVLPGMSAPTPVTSVPVTELLAVHPESLIDGLAELPSLSSSTTPSTIGGRTTLGQGSFLNLRNLGTAETLVLFNGVRVIPSNIQGNVDVSLLPQALISNVDIVTGGASAAYGSDAVAGVINFILNDKFTGFKVDAGTGISSVGDGASDKVSLAWGSGFLDDRLHIVASFDWHHSQPAYAANRGWANAHCAVVSTPGVTTATQSPTNPLTQFACNATQPGASYGGAITSGPLTTATQGISFGPGGVPMPFIYGPLKTTNFQVGGTGDPAYLADAENFITPLDTKMAFGHLSYDINDNVEAFAQLTASRSDSEYAETPSNFEASRPITIFSGNAFLPASIQARMTQLNLASFQLGIVPKSWGNIVADDSEEAYDAIAGLKGKFGAGWSWEAHYEHGRSQWKMTQPGQAEDTNLFRAADAVVGPNGSIVCQSAIANPAAYGSCVPINLFGPGSASPQALAYIMGQGAVLSDDNVMTQDDASASINGQPFSTWAGPISFAAGAEWRRLQGVQSTDAISRQTPLDFTGIRGVPPALVSQVGGWMATNPQSVNGSYHVTEGFAELLVPLAKDMTLAKELTLNAAGRVTSYSQSGTVETWKFGATWRPVDEWLLRVSESRDIRAPNVANLYAGFSTSAVTVTDPFRNGGSFSIKNASVGNPDLVPERAKTFTVGTTYQPSWFNGLALSVDYYDIKINDELASVTPQQEINGCYQGAQSYCPLLLRDSSGSLYIIETPTLNLNSARSRGIDLDINYRADALGGAVGARLVGTRLLEQSTTVSSVTGSVYTDLAGSLSQGNPTWLLNLVTSYDRGPIGFDLSGRFVNSGQYNTSYTTGQLDPEDMSIPSNFTVNAGLRYKLESLPGTPVLYFSVQNVFDKAPPLIPSTALTSFQTNAQLYDSMGRFFFGGVRMSF